MKTYKYIKNSALFFALIVCVLLLSCSSSDVIRTARIAVTGDSAAAGRLAAEKAASYAVHPERIGEDLRRVKDLLDRFRNRVGGVWGSDDAREPSSHEYVKYTQNYLCRAAVDFNRGVVTVETVDEENPLESLKNAVVTTVLTPEDPRAVDLYSDSEIKLGGEPFLLGLVKDFDGKNIRWHWRAERFADEVLRRRLDRRVGSAEDRERVVHFVTIDMTPDYRDVRAMKYRHLVERYAGEFGISRSLVYAVMKTESSFNPFAVSRSQALGLMQVMPSTAGRDVYRVLNGKDGIPSRDFLFLPDNNIRYGTAYLNLLRTRYLEGVKNELSLEYCVIAAYNAGAGEVLRTFDRDRSRAASIINSMPPLDVYEYIRDNIPKEETRRYIVKVLNAKKDFVKF